MAAGQMRAACKDCALRILGRIDDPAADLRTLATQIRDTMGLVLAELAMKDEPASSPHVHTRACYEDPGPGHGPPFLICGYASEGEVR